MIIPFHSVVIYKVHSRVGCGLGKLALSNSTQFNKYFLNTILNYVLGIRGDPEINKIGYNLVGKTEMFITNINAGQCS